MSSPLLDKSLDFATQIVLFYEVALEFYEKACRSDSFVFSVGKKESI